MSIADSNRKTSKDEHDFFQTLPCQVKCLCDHFDFTGLKILDAGAGKRIIADGIKKEYPKVKIKTSEKNSSNNYNKTSSFDFDNNKILSGNERFPRSSFGDFLKVRKHFDYIISNPPYSQKDSFIQHALNHAYNVVMLFPLQVLNYIYFCEKWLDNPKYLGRITMYPKVILNPGGNYIQGGNTGYGWFHWTNNNNIADEEVITKYEIFDDIRKYK